MKRCCNLIATAGPRDGTSQLQLSVHPPLYKNAPALVAIVKARTIISLCQWRSQPKNLGGAKKIGGAKCLIFGK